MRELFAEGAGGPEVVTSRISPAPTPAAHEVLVAVAGAGVNRADLLQCAGHYAPPPGASDVLGLELAGTVTALGPGVTRWRVGDRVAGLVTSGGYSEQLAVHEGLLLPVPDGINLADAAGLPEALTAAWAALVESCSLRRGEFVLVRGASGGVGSLAVQLAAAMGATVIATAGGPERVAKVAALGVHTVIDHRLAPPSADSPLVAAVMAATSGHGVDVILDVLGAGGLAENLACLATGGRLAVIGLQRGAKGEIDLAGLMAKRASIHAMTLRARSQAERIDLVATVARDVWPLVTAGNISPVIGRTFTFDDAPAALQSLADGSIFGKVVLVP